SADPLPDGGLLLVCRPMVIEYDKAGNQTWTHARPTNDILAGRRLPNGETVFVTSATQGPNCFRLDAKGNPVGKPVQLGRVQNQAMVGMDVVGDDAVLVCE